MSDEKNDGISQDFLNKFIQNRLDSSDVDFFNEDPNERLKVINTLFKIIIGIHGKAFAEQYDNHYAKDVWFNGLLLFSIDEIANGLELMMQDEFVGSPNLRKFIQYCTEAKSGVNYIKDKQLKNDHKRLPKLKREKKNLLD